jgi:hypothetical protein
MILGNGASAAPSTTQGLSLKVWAITEIAIEKEKVMSLRDKKKYLFL